MRLSECFERIDTDIWAKHLNINKILFTPDIISDDSQSNAQNWLRRIIGVYSGNINFKVICNEYISKNDIYSSYSVLKYIENHEKGIYEDKIKECYIEDIKKRRNKVKELNKRINNLEEKKIVSIEQDLLDNIWKRIQIIENDKSPHELNEYNLQINDKIKLELNELEDEIWLIEAEITAREKVIFKAAFDLYEKLIKKIRPFLESSKIYEKKIIERCFFILPKLTMSGNTKLLNKITEKINENEIDKLSEIISMIPTEFKTETKKDILSIIKKRSDKLKTITKYKFRATTEQYLKNVQPIDIRYKDENEVRQFIDRKVKESKTYRESGMWLLAGANKLITMGETNIEDIRSKGLAELGEYLLRNRKYIHAFEIFADTFSILVSIKTDIDNVSIDERKVATFMLLTNWLPRIISMGKRVNTQEIVDAIVNNPSDMLETIVEQNDLDILFHCFDQFDEIEQLKLFLKYLNDTNNKIDWESIIIDRVLQTRLFFHNTDRSIKQLRALSLERYDKYLIGKIIDKVAIIIDSYIYDDRMLRSDVNEVEVLNKNLENKIRTDKKYRLRPIQLFQENITRIIEAVNEKVLIASEIQFAVRPVGTIYYLNEKSKNIDLIISVTLAETSLPINFFIAEARVEEKYREQVEKYIKINNPRNEFGPIEPNSSIEIKFKFDVDPKMLEYYDKISIEFNLFDGIKAIIPSDKKKTYEINFQTKRKGSKRNPYIAGPAIEIGGLYVGREKEIKQIKNTLMGESQDSIPLILGIRRIGKTSLLKRIISDNEIHRRYVPILYDLQDMQDSETTKEFFRKICIKVHNKCGKKMKIPFSRTAFEDDPLDALENYFMNFNSAKGTNRILIIFDEFEKLIANLRIWQERSYNSGTLQNARNALIPEIFGTLRKMMLHANRFSFIISGLPGIKKSFQEYEARWFGLMSPININPLEDSEAKELIQPDSIPYDISPEASKEILYMTGSQPYLIQLICKNLFDEVLISGKGTVSRLDVINLVERDILPNEEYFFDYYRLMGEDKDIIKAIAICHKKVGKRRRFVSVSEILDILNTLHIDISKDILINKLEEMEKEERPLVKRSPSKSDSYRVVIGMLNSLLEE